MKRQTTSAERGFTLIEILIVVFILGILAAIVMVSVSGAGQEARESVLRNELQFMRTQIAVYKASHADAPGVDANGQAVAGLAEDQLTGFTDYFGNLVARDTPKAFAPYLSQVPSNPVVGKTTIKLVSTGVSLAAAVDDTTGWLYKPETLEFCANSTDFGPTGRNW